MDQQVEARRLRRQVWIAVAGTCLPLAGLLLYRFSPEWKSCQVWLAYVHISFLCGVPRPKPGGLVDFVLDALGEGLTVVVFIELLLRTTERRHMLSVIDASLRTTIQLIFSGEDRHIFNQLSDKQRTRIVHGSLVGTLGDEYGDVVYNQIVSPYMAREVSYRKHFFYRITCYDALADANPSLRSDETVAGFLESVAQDHVWVKQELAYQLHGTHSAKPLPRIFAKFALSSRQLNRFIAADDLFFRELVRVSARTRVYLQGIAEEKLSEFVRNVFQLKAFSIDGRMPIEFQARRVRDIDDTYLEVSIANPSGKLEGSGCLLEFVLPHLRRDSQFLVTLPQPVESGAEIAFTKSPSMVGLSYIPFISSFKSGTYHEELLPPSDPDTIKIKTDGWAFPTGGLMFVWSTTGS